MMKLLLLLLAWSLLTGTTCWALQPRRRIVGAELLGTAQIPRDTTVPGATGVVGGLSGLSSDSASGERIYAVSDRGDVFSGTVTVSTTEGLRVVLDRAFHVGITGGSASRPLYVDAEGIAVCRSGGGRESEAPLLVSTEDPPRVARLHKADGSVWTGPPDLPPVRLSHIINETSTRRNGQLESLSCWTGGDSAEGISLARSAPAAGTIFTANELSLRQDSEPPELWDSGTIGGSVRIFSINRSTGTIERTTRYVLDRRAGNGLVDLEVVASGGGLLTMERSYQRGVGNTIKIYTVDSLTEVADASGCASVSEWSGCAAAVTKRLVVDLGSVDGLELDNFEGMAMLPQPLPDGRRVLLLVNDNNFSPMQLPTTFVALALIEEVTVTPSSELGSLVGNIRTVPVGAPLDGLEGRYSDPNHPDGFRTVVLSHSTVQERAAQRISEGRGGTARERGVTIAGNDNAPTGVEWTLFGRLRIEADTILLTIDFSPKGGPAGLVAVFDGSGLQFSDGNRWTRQDTASNGAVELVAAFKGIPYASPPVGHRRFAAPEPYARRYAAGTGRRLGAACPQTAWLSYYAPEDYSEDCLFLNVYTPLSRLESSHGSNSSATASRGGSVGGGAPVLVFLHGGSFLWGSSSIFDGSKLAAAADMVVVSVNYRLGVLGMLPTPPVPPDTSCEANFGLMDQQMALRWVHRWAHLFGGAQSRIMLMGESAGAVAVLIHLTLPASGPGTMFQSAAVHSAPCVTAPHELGCVSSLEKAQRTVAEPLAAAAGCMHRPFTRVDSSSTAGLLDNGQLECLRALPVETIVELTNGLRQQGSVFHPVYGVRSIPTDPIAKLMAEGTPVRRVLLGWNKHDGTQFAPGSWAADSETNATHCCPVPILPVSEALWTEQLRAALGQQPELEAQARALYSAQTRQQEENEDQHAASNGVDRWWELVDQITDAQFRCPTLRIAERLSAHHADTERSGQEGGIRVFQFNHRSRYSHAPPRWGVYHASELQYLFDVRYPYLLGASDYTAAERELMRGVQRTWAAVARGATAAQHEVDAGHEGADGKLAWPAFSGEEPWVLQLEASTGDLSKGLRPVIAGSASAARCSFWEHEVGYYGHDTGATPWPRGGGQANDHGTHRRETEGERHKERSAVLPIALVVLLVGCCWMGTASRRKATKSGSYESLQVTDIQSDQGRLQAPAGKSKRVDKLPAARP